MIIVVAEEIHSVDSVDCESEGKSERWKTQQCNQIRLITI